MLTFGASQLWSWPKGGLLIQKKFTVKDQAVQELEWKRTPLVKFKKQDWKWTDTTDSIILPYIYCWVCKWKNIKIDDYLAMLQERTWLSRALVRVANTLLKDGKSARDDHVLACNFAKYSEI